MAQVQVIQPYQPQSDTLEKVAAYCRVSTDSKDQLMFPTIAEYIDGQYIKGGQAVRIADPNVIAELEKVAHKIINLLHRGVRFTPTQPDVLHIEQL